MSDPNTAPTQTTPQPPVNDDAVAKKDAEIAQLKQQLAEKEAAEAQAKIDAEQQANADFAEGLVNEGKLAPANKDMVVAMLNAIDTANRAEPIDFGEGDDKQPLKQAVKEKLSDASTYSHLFSESASKDKQPATPHLEFGENVDSERLALHQEILAYAEKNNVDYATASVAVVNK